MIIIYLSPQYFLKDLKLYDFLKSRQSSVIVIFASLKENKLWNIKK